MGLAYGNKYSGDSLHQLSKQIATLDFVRIQDFDQKMRDVILPAVYLATQLKGLSLIAVDGYSLQYLLDVLPKFPNLQEIDIPNSNLLVPIHSLSGVTHLRLFDYATQDPNLCYYLLELLNNSKNTLRGMQLWQLDKIGIRSWTAFLGRVQLCNRLVEIQLGLTSIETDDVTHWSSAVSKCTSLVSLYFYKLTLYDRGFISLCEGLVYHPVIRYITICCCNHTSVCCEYLMYLIPTISQLESMTVDNLYTPDDKPLEELMSGVLNLPSIFQKLVLNQQNKHILLMKKQMHTKST